MKEPRIEIEQLRKVYRLGKGPSMLPWRRGDQQRKEVVALDGIELRLNAGTVLGVIGRNGSGKSTLLKILARVSPPTAGRAVVRGRVVSMLELGAAFEPDATGRQNVFLNAALNGISRAVVRRRLDEIMEFAGLNEFIDTPVARYSSGMYLRLAFSVAVHLEPDILLADEILAVGDIAFQERCLSRIEEEGKRGLTVLFVSHDLAAVRRLCTRAVWLERGRVVAEGDPEEVTTAYEMKALGEASSLEARTDSSDVGALHDVRLVDGQGLRVETLGLEQEAFLDADVTVRHAPISAWPAAVVYAHGLVVFRSGLDEPLEFDRPGTYRLRMRIPPRLLAETTYEVKFGVTFFEGAERWPVVRRRAAVVRVADSEGATKRYDPGTQGLVRPRLDWSVEPISDAIPAER